MTSPLFEQLLDYVGHRQRAMFLNTLYGELHNVGYDLQGNTEETDLEWFAESIYTSATGQAPWRWDQEDEHEQERYRLMARAAIKQLPGLCERMSARLVRQSQLVKTVMEAHVATLHAVERHEA